MDCVNARQLLDVFGRLDVFERDGSSFGHGVSAGTCPSTPTVDPAPETDQSVDSDLMESAFEHLRGCRDCQAVFKQQVAEDASIRAALNAVTLPPMLLPKLLSNAAAAKTAAEVDLQTASRAVEPTPSADSPGTLPRLITPAVSAAPRVGRRMMRRTAVAVSCVAGLALLVAVCWPAWPTVDIDTASLSLVNVLQQKAITAAAQAGGTHARSAETGDLSQPELFGAVFSPPPDAAAAFPIPQTMALSERVIERRRQWLVSQGQFADVYFFGLRNSSTSIQRGALLVLPRRWVNQPSACSVFLCGPVTYQLPYCTTRWCEGDMQYVCVLEGSSDGLLELRNAPDAG